MAIFIIFRQGIEAHIIDKFVQGETHYYFVENKRTYISQRIAFKRAIIYCKKRSGLPLRRKRKRRAILIKPQLPILAKMPTIETIYENGIKKYKVIETGKKFKRERTALRNAFNYATKKKR